MSMLSCHRVDLEVEQLSPIYFSLRMLSISSTHHLSRKRKICVCHVYKTDNLWYTNCGLILLIIIKRHVVSLIFSQRLETTWDEYKQILFREELCSTRRTRGNFVSIVIGGRLNDECFGWSFDLCYWELQEIKLRSTIERNLFDDLVFISYHFRIK